MREIMFRGKRLDNGEWVEGCFGCHTKFDAFIIHRPYPTMDGDFAALGFYEVDPNTVGQYTGLCDKNGKKIFEGDILKLDYIGPGRGVQGVAEVVFKYGKFCMPWGHRKELVPLDGFANTTMEIIGNIHDNPELLGGGE